MKFQEWFASRRGFKEKLGGDKDQKQNMMSCLRCPYLISQLSPVSYQLGIEKDQNWQTAFYVLSCHGVPDCAMFVAISSLGTP